MRVRPSLQILALSVLALGCGPGTAGAGESGESGEESGESGETDTDTEGNEPTIPLDCTQQGDQLVETQVQLEGLTEVCAIEGELELRGELLEELAPLSELQRVGGRLELDGCAGLDSLAPLSSLRQIDETLTMLDAAPGSSFAGLGGLERIGGLSLWDLPELESFAGLPDTLTLDATHGEFPGAGIVVASTPALTSLEQLPSFEFVGVEGGEQALTVGFMDLELDSVAQLADWPLEDAEVKLAHLPLTDLDGLSATQLEYLELISLPELVDLRGLEDLERVGALVVYGNDSLLSFAGLDRLEHADYLVVGGCYYLYAGRWEGTTMNPQMTDFTGLESLTSIGHLLLHNQPALTSLAGLENVESIEVADIRDNPLLPAEEVAQWLEARGLPSAYDPGSFCGNAGQEPCTPCP